MNNVKSASYLTEYECNFIKWGVIILGTFIGLAVTALLNLLGIGLGLVSFDMNLDKLLNLGTSSILWLTFSGVVAMAIAGWVIGRFSGLTVAKANAYHGFFSWCLTTLCTFLITTTSAGTVIGGSANLVKNVVTSVQAVAPQRVEQQVNQAVTRNEQDVMDPNAVTVNPEQIASSAGKGAIILFIAFLISAIVSCLTASWGTKKNFNV